MLEKLNAWLEEAESIRRSIPLESPAYTYVSRRIDGFQQVLNYLKIRGEPGEGDTATEFLGGAGPDCCERGETMPDNPIVRCPLCQTPCHVVSKPVLGATWASSVYEPVDRDAQVAHLAGEVARLKAEADKSRERANDAQVAWELHRDTCAMHKIREELAAAFGTENPVEAAKVLRAMQAELARYRAGTVVHKRERPDLEIEA